MSKTLDEMRGGDESFLRRKTRPSYEGLPAPLRLVDLFSGSGGLTLGVAEACRAVGRGLDVRLAMELEERVRDVYDLNFMSGAKDNRGDVRGRFDRMVGRPLSDAELATQRQVGPVDILVGGPPCQGHSDLNNHTRRNDEKNELYLVMVRAAEVLKPEFVLIENVQGVRRDHGDVLRRAIAHLERLKYRVDERLVHMVDLGVPQKRVRHILVASREADVRGVLDFPKLVPPRPLRWAVEELLEHEGTTDFDTPSKLSAENARRAQLLLASGEYNLDDDYRPACHRDKRHTYKAMYGRLDWDKPAHTITTGFGSPGQGRFLHPSKPRTLTPHEAARVQFFPDWFRFGRSPSRGLLAHCIGNAVPPKLAFSVLVRLLRTAAKGSEGPADAAPRTPSRRFPSRSSEAA